MLIHTQKNQTHLECIKVLSVLNLLLLLQRCDFLLKRPLVLTCISCQLLQLFSTCGSMWISGDQYSGRQSWRPCLSLEVFLQLSVVLPTWTVNLVRVQRLLSQWHTLEHCPSPGIHVWCLWQLQCHRASRCSNTSILVTESCPCGLRLGLKVKVKLALEKAGELLRPHWRHAKKCLARFFFSYFTVCICPDTYSQGCY